MKAALSKKRHLGQNILHSKYHPLLHQGPLDHLTSLRLRTIKTLMENVVGKSFALTYLTSERNDCFTILHHQLVGYLYMIFIYTRQTFNVGSINTTLTMTFFNVLIKRIKDLACTIKLHHHYR